MSSVIFSALKDHWAFWYLSSLKYQIEVGSLRVWLPYLPSCSMPLSVLCQASNARKISVYSVPSFQVTEHPSLLPQGDSIPSGRTEHQVNYYSFLRLSTLLECVLKGGRLRDSFSCVRALLEGDLVPAHLSVQSLTGCHRLWEGILPQSSAFAPVRVGCLQGLKKMETSNT